MTIRYLRLNLDRSLSEITDTQESAKLYETLSKVYYIAKNIFISIGHISNFIERTTTFNYHFKYIFTNPQK